MESVVLSFAFFCVLFAFVTGFLRKTILWPIIVAVVSLLLCIQFVRTNIVAANELFALSIPVLTLLVTARQVRAIRPLPINKIKRAFFELLRM